MSWLAIELYRYNMIKFGEFKLSSGLTSPFYIDLRRIYGYPQIMSRVVNEILSRVPLKDIDVIAGVETAGIPLAAYISCYTGKPLVYVRKEKKSHGLGNAVEGEVTGKRVIIVDDVVTTGSSILRAINHVKDVGGFAIRALVIVDREQGARELLREHGVEMYSLTTSTELFTQLYLNKLIDEGTYTSLINYIRSSRRV
ncbi:MAG: orotate phosphoribosyltransferase [Desulfurococcaceae archaeon]